MVDVSSQWSNLNSLGGMILTFFMLLSFKLAAETGTFPQISQGDFTCLAHQTAVCEF
jgi:hypothetical protein